MTSTISEEFLVSDYATISDSYNPPQVFVEAVLCRHKLGLRTKDPDPAFREIIVEPFYLSTADYRPTPVYEHFVTPRPSLWCHVPRPNGDGILTNRDILLEDIVGWKIMSADDLTSRRLPKKRLYLFEGHPFQRLLIEADIALRSEWSRAMSLPDFDPTPFVEKDRRLGEIATEVEGWFKR